MREYERPANTNPSKRIQNALGILDKYQGSSYYGSGLGYGPDFGSFAQDANTIAQTMGGLLYSKLTGGSWRDGMSAVGNMDSGISSIFGNSSNYTNGNFSFGGSTSAVPDLVNYTPSANVDPKQNELVQKMRSILGKIRYSTAGGDPQDPDKGVASCASTVGWAYRKVLGITGMHAGAGYQAADSRFSTVYQKQSSGQRPDLSKLQPGDIIYEDWRNPYKYDTPFDSTRLFNGSTPYYHMSHAEMYAGNGQALSHGGPGYGPIAVNVDADRKKGIMLVRRYTPFIEAARNRTTGSVTSATPPLAPFSDTQTALKGMTDTEKQEYIRKELEKTRSQRARDIADPTLMLQRLGTGPLGYGSSKSRISTGFKAMPSARTTPYADRVYYGTATGYPSAASLRDTMRTGSTDQKLDAILGVISEWYDDSKKNPGLGNVNITNSTTNTMISADGKTETKHTAVKPTEPSNDRLRSLYDSIARINT